MVNVGPVSVAVSDLSKINKEGKLELEYHMSLMKYVFIMHRTNYCRWMSVDRHVDRQLPSVFPDTYKHHVSGGFFIQKSNRKSSSIHGHQGHKQSNDIFKETEPDVPSPLLLLNKVLTALKISYLNNPQFFSFLTLI